MMNATAYNHLRLIEQDKRFDQLAASPIRAALATTVINDCKTLRVSPESMRAKTIAASVSQTANQIDPDPNVIVITGYPDGEILNRILRLPGHSSKEAAED